MKNFDKKILIMTFFVLVIACVAIYFFTKDEDYEDISQSQLIQNENSVDNSEIIVHVDGEVLKPGIVHLYSESRISDAIEKCGGLTELADTSKINLAYKIKDGQKIHIPNIYDKDETSLIQNDAGEEIIIQQIQISESYILKRHTNLSVIPYIMEWQTAGKVCRFVM